MKRRHFLSGGAMLTASGLGVAGSLVQGAIQGFPGQDSPGQQSAGQGSSARGLVVLQDMRIQLDPAIVKRLFISSVEIVPLTEDPVRLWRSDAGELLRRPEIRLLGVTGWADYLMVRGLAAETRRHVRHEHHNPDSGTFTWLIA